MLVTLMWEPDEACTDPLDSAATPRRHADVIDDDVIVVWRKQTGDPDADGAIVWHVASMGIFQNVTPAEVRKALRKIVADL